MLNDSINVGSLKLKNRIVMAPIALEKSNHGTVSDELLEYYRARTDSGNIGLVVVEHSFIRSDGRASLNQLSCANDEDICGLKKLAKVIHQNGSKCVMEINHAGGAVKKDVTGEKALSPSGVKNPFGTRGKGEFQDSEEMSIKDIDDIIKCFIDAAIRTKNAGFDGCEIHSAHGYLLNQFYSPLTNRRTDEYTGYSIEGRILLHKKIIQEIRKVVGNEFLLSMRFGGCDYKIGGSTIEDAVIAAKEFEKAGLNLLDVSGGMCSYVRDGHTESGYFSDLSEAIKAAVNIPVIVAGGVKKITDAEQLLCAQKADLIGVGRAIVKNENWASEQI